MLPFHLYADESLFYGTVAFDVIRPPLKYHWELLAGLKILGLLSDTRRCYGGKHVRQENFTRTEWHFRSSINTGV